ncbi:hypothetical protein CAP36_14040 [Chitinophagaceae bacterium IBVUCB2]|nr:hypothetical protein CAP36_14040 [Chitinophagaceae bacterium IBVUCB2]
MNKKLQLSIAEPCHENWDNMSPVEKGKFCGSCQKQVVDFTGMSDRQVAAFFKKPSTGSVCGRFMTDQLERDIDIPKKRIPWVKYFFGFLLPALFVSKASAQKNNKAFVSSTKDTVRTPITSEFRTLGMVLPKNIMAVENNKQDSLITKSDKKPVVFKTTISGIVANEKGEPIPFASITTGIKGFGTLTDENGVFSLPVSHLSKDSVLHVSSVGYQTSDIKVDIEDASGSKLIVNLHENIMGQITVSTSDTICSEVIAGTVSYVIKSNDNVTTEVKAQPRAIVNKISVYPNPLLSGGDLTIEWNKSEEGYFLLQLLNLSGQQVHKKEIWIDADARILSLDIPKVAAGSYFIVFTNKRSGRKYSEKIIIK